MLLPTLELAGPADGVIVDARESDWLAITKS
jgi:hypothetical protein